MNYIKSLQVVSPKKRMQSNLNRINNQGKNNPVNGQGVGGNYSSVLPEIYAGHPQRIQRYAQYQQMDQDSDINGSLDTIADFSTQADATNGKLFEFNFDGEPSDTEVKILSMCLKKWTNLNEFQNRLWRMVRSTLMYGDQFFLRDPETLKWMYIDPSMVESVFVNVNEGKKVIAYAVRDLVVNEDMLVASDQTQYGSNLVGLGTNTLQNNIDPASIGGAGYMTHYNSGTENITIVKAEHIVHLSLSEGLDASWPFGTSFLESVYKVYRQKSLLEDAMLIYRIQRAPERRVFYIDTGDLPPHKAHQYIERVKNETRQRRIPTRNGGGASVTDAAYNPLCLDLNTRIPLLDGRTLNIKQLAEEYNNGKENWVYSCNPETGEVVPGNITWAGVTRKNAKVLKITLDNGETLTCTPDHKIPVQNKGFVEAQYLTSEDSLFPFNTRLKSLSKDPNRSYQQVYDISCNKWKYTHRIVGEFFKNINKHQEFTFIPEFKGMTKDTIHHKDYNRYNNDPRNLQWMNKKDHILYHSIVKKEYWNEMPDKERLRIVEKIRLSVKEAISNYSFDKKENMRKNCSIGLKKAISDMKINDPEKWNKWRSNCGKSISQNCKSDNKKALKRVEHLKEYQNKAWNNIKFIWSFEMKQRFVELVKANNYNREDALINISKDEKFLNFMKEANNKKGGINNIDLTKLTDKKLKSFFKEEGYDNWKDFKNKIVNFNHRIISIEWLEETMDVGTITVDGNERWNNYHTFAIESGIFVKNSMIEDYFFSQSSSGRGSKVTTLEGGDALSSIDDMKYFSNVLKRGLRVPASYLPTGPEDNGVVFNDGRAGTAYIQEFRFAEFCRRIQRLLTPVFNKEFKKFIEESGYTIDPDLYDISFNPPQHFADFARIERDVAMINTFTPLVDIPWMSKRFLLLKYLGWTEDEIAENEIKWAEEQPEDETEVTMTNGMEGAAGSSGLPGLDSVGVRTDDQLDTDSNDEDIAPADTESDNSDNSSGGLSSTDTGEE